MRRTLVLSAKVLFYTGLAFELLLDLALFNLCWKHSSTIEQLTVIDARLVSQKRAWYEQFKRGGRFPGRVLTKPPSHVEPISPGLVLDSKLETKRKLLKNDQELLDVKIHAARRIRWNGRILVVASFVVFFIDYCLKRSWQPRMESLSDEEIWQELDRLWEQQTQKPSE